MKSEMNIHVSEVGARNILNALQKIKGGYCYSGAASYQMCFPLKAGGELRIMMCDESPHGTIDIDLYDGALSPGITGPTISTGQ